MAELGQRLSALEFEEWKVFMAIEQLQPIDTVRRHAGLMAAAARGPLVPADRSGLWSAADFYEPEPWQWVARGGSMSDEAGPSEPDIEAHVAHQNARLH